VLDALLPSLDVLDAASDTGARSVLDEMVRAAEQGVRDTTELVSQRGRAAWVGERSAGHPDPGATAYLRLLQSLAADWPRP
jgi:dihydroxyacetone kinase